MSKGSEEQGAERRALEAIQALMRALAHRVRTPLSVVSNELTYLSKVYQKDECRRAMERCQSISQILKSATLPLDPAVSAQSISLEEFLKCCLPAPAAIVPGSAGQLLINAQEAKEAFLLVEQIMAETSPGIGGSWQVEVNSGTSLLSLRREVSVQAVPEKAAAGSAFSSFSSFFCTACGLDVLAAPLADVLLWANRAEVEIVYDQPCRVQIVFPLNGVG